MEFKLDHVFIMVSEGAPEADQLIQFGLSEGKPNTHLGQGTSNRRFFFQNFMLELLWVHDSKEARNKNTEPTLLWQRWTNRNKKSPFGICLRPVEKWGNALPIRSWEYNPNYLPNGELLFISESSKNLSEPMIFIAPFGEQQENIKKFPNVNHSKGLKEITSVSIHLPIIEDISDDLKFISGFKNMSVEKSKSHSLELTIDGQREGKSKKFDPQLPLLIKW